MTTAAALFEAIRAGRQPADPRTLEALYDLSAAIDDEAFMFGEWEGGIFNSGHEAEAQLKAINWAGKAFHDAETVDPIVCLDAGGKRFANRIAGGARLRCMRHRGVVTATMIYDGQPVWDHFRKIDDDLVVGAMDRKGDRELGFFYLRRLGA